MLADLRGLSILVALFTSTLQSPARHNLLARKTGRTNPKNVSAATPATNVNAEEKQTDSLAKIDELSEDGRLILFICRDKCSKQRAEIPKWVEEFNADYNTSANDDVLNYHIHSYKHPIGRYNADNLINRRNYLLLYIIGPLSIPYNKEIATKTSFWKWLTSLENIINYSRFRSISTENDINVLLDSVSYRCKYDYPSYNSYGIIEDGGDVHIDNANSSDKSADQYENILEPSTAWERRRIAQNEKDKTTGYGLTTPKPAEYRQRMYISKSESSATLNRNQHYENRLNSQRKNGRIDDLYRRKIKNQNPDEDRSIQSVKQYRQRRDQTQNDITIDFNRNELAFHKVILIVHHPDLCPTARLANFVRTLSNNESVTIAELRRPLIAEVDVILRQRLIGIQYKCQLIILMNNNKFVQLSTETTVTKMHNFVNTWHIESDDACVRNLSPLDRANRIRHSLTDAEMIYYKEEVLIQRIEFSHAFIIVGVVGGLAVIALAISIFWGLNGTSFVSK